MSEQMVIPLSVRIVLLDLLRSNGTCSRSIMCLDPFPSATEISPSRRPTLTLHILPKPALDGCLSTDDIERAILLSSPQFLHFQPGGSFAICAITNTRSSPYGLS